MDISRINIALLPSDLLRTPVKTESTSAQSNSRAAVVDKSGSATVQEVPQTQNPVRNDFITKQLEDILVNFPPWFPPGAPQRLDLIKSITGIQEKVAQTPVQNEMLRMMAGPKPSDESTDKELYAAVEGTLRFTQVFSDKTTSTADTGTAGTIVNIKV